MPKKPAKRTSRSAPRKASPAKASSRKAGKKAAKKVAKRAAKKAATKKAPSKKARSGAAASGATSSKKSAKASPAAKKSGANAGSPAGKKAAGKAAKKTARKVGAKSGAPSRAAPASGGISDEAVLRATGKTWEQWFAILDRFDVAKNGHKAAAIHLHEKHGCGEWWSQMVVVGYEQGRGLREKHQTPRGYQVGASKTIGAPVERAFDEFADPRARLGWLPGIKLEIRKATRPKSLRITFLSGADLAGYDEKPSNVDVNLYSKGAARCQLQVQHDKLANAEDGERMKTYWQDALERLRERLER